MKPSEAKEFKENLQNIRGNPHSPTGLHIATRTAGTAFRKAKQAGGVYDDMDVLLDAAFCKMVILSNLCLPYHLTDFNCMFAQQQSEMDRLRQPLGTISQIVGNVGKKNPTK